MLPLSHPHGVLEKQGLGPDFHSRILQSCLLRKPKELSWTGLVYNVCVAFAGICTIEDVFIKAIERKIITYMFISENIFKTPMFCILYCKCILPFYLNLKLREYLFSKLCGTIETAIKFELESLRSLYSTFDIYWCRTLFLESSVYIICKMAIIAADLQACCIN